MMMAEGESRRYSWLARLPYTASNCNPASSTSAFTSATVYARTECSHDSRFPSGKMTVFFQFKRPARASNCHSLSTMRSLTFSQVVGLNSRISFSRFQRSSNSLPPGFNALWTPCNTCFCSCSSLKRPKDTNILSTTSNAPRKSSFLASATRKIKMNTSVLGYFSRMLNLCCGDIQPGDLKPPLSQLNTMSAISATQIENACPVLWMKQRHDLLNLLFSKVRICFLVQIKIDLPVVDVFPPFHAGSLAEKLSACKERKTSDYSSLTSQRHADNTGMEALCSGE